MQKVKLGDICKIFNGYAFKSEKYVASGIRIIRITNVQKGFIEDKTPCYYPEESLSDIKNYILCENDLLISLTGNVGRVGLLPKLYLPAALNQRVACLRIKDELFLAKKYLFHYLNSTLFESNCIKFSQGVAQKNLSTEWLKEYEIKVPLLAEQKAIAEKLDKVSILIEKRKQQLSLLDTLVKSKFVEMFGEGNQSNFELVPLYKVSKKIFAGGDKPKKTVAVKDNIFQYPVYANGYENEGLQGYSCEYKVDEYAITISARGTIGYCFIRAPYFTPAVRLITIVPNKECNIIYLKCALQNLDLKASGTSQAQLTVPLFRQERIAVPPICLQNKFANFVKQTEKLKEKIKQSLAALELLKKSLMQKYFG